MDGRSRLVTSGISDPNADRAPAIARRAVKVKRHDDNALVIEDFPIGIGIFGFSMSLFLAGALV